MDPQNPNPSETDLLEALRERIKTTQEAAERIAAETQAAVSEAARANGERSGERPPASGYAVPGAGPGAGDTSDMQALVALIELARGIVPPELSGQLAELFRELLLLARAIIDWYLDRLERRRATPVEVEDIPII
jgi:hypothetical protein